MLMQFSTTWEPVKFNAQAIITSQTGATTILIQLSPAGLIPGLMLMQLSPPMMAHSLMLMQLSPTTLDHDQFSCNFQLFPTKFCNAHLMQHYNYHQIRWILNENWMRIEWELTFHFCLGYFVISGVFNATHAWILNFREWVAGDRPGGRHIIFHQPYFVEYYNMSFPRHHQRTQVSALCVVWMGILLSTYWQFARHRDSHLLGLQGLRRVADHVNSLFLESQVSTRIPPHIIAYPQRCIPSVSGRGNLTLLLLLLNGDIAVNPGPMQHDVNTAPRPVSVFPCDHCELAVNWSDHAICCDSCSIWYHRSCHDMSVTQYRNLGDESWKCNRCHTPLWDTFHSYEVIDIVRQNSVHSTHDAWSRITSDTSLPSPSSFRPPQHSTPEATGNSLPSAAPHAPSPTWPLALALQPAVNTTLPPFYPRTMTGGLSLLTLTV